MKVEPATRVRDRGGRAGAIQIVARDALERDAARHGDPAEDAQARAGADKLTQWSEAAPYLLTIVVATHHAFFGHVDLIILGGYSLATWLTERLSNEVAARTRQANRSINDRFEIAGPRANRTGRRVAGIPRAGVGGD
jgi:hypothetical protein